MSQSEFNSFTRSEGASNCIISFELELYQSENFDSNETHQFSSDIESKIKLFTLFASNCQESKCVVTAVSCDVLPQGAKILLYEPKKRIPRDFNFPIPVEKPVSAGPKSWDRITIEWDRPCQQIDQPIGYTVSFQSENGSSWATKDIEGDVVEAEINELEPNTEYVFKVAPMFNYGHGPDSEVSDAIVTHKQPLPIKIIKDSTLSEKYSGDKLKCSKDIWKLKTELIEDDQQMVSKVEFGKPQLSKHTKIFMAMGATGAGKSTLINGMINYILGVKYDDNFRFVLISDETKKSEAHSQTSAITVYKFYWQEGFIVPYNLIFIDTPGFGDTRGMDQDIQTVRQLTALFSKEKIEFIHAIGFVVQASLVRLTAGQKYIFDSVQSIFGKDVVNNIVIMATFADDENPKAMAAIKEAEVKHFCAFTFNNIALYASKDGETKEMKEYYWNFCSKNMNSFFSHLAIVNPTTMHLTRDVLNERKQLEMILNGLQPKIQDMATKVEILRTEEKLLTDHESGILSNRSFTYTVKVTNQRRKDLEPGVHVTNCINCHFTCHSPCSISDNSKKYECSAMDKGGQGAAKCTVCPKKCPWNDHYNNPYCFESYDETVTRTSEELRERYNIAENSKEEATRAIEKLQDELNELSIAIYRDLHEARRCQDCLSKIALKKSPMSDSEYIDQLIETEMNENNPGASSRIEMYSNMKKKAEIMINYTEEQIEEELQKKDKKAWYQVIWSRLFNK